MKYNIDKTEVKGDKVTVYVTVTHENGVVEKLQKDFDHIEPPAILNIDGYRLANDGKYYHPEKKQGTKWVPSDPPPSGWAVAPEHSQEKMLKPLIDSSLLRHVNHADYIKGVGNLRPFVSNGIRIVPFSQPRLHPDLLVVEIQLTAYDVVTGKKLDLGDGIIHFNNPPRVKDGIDNPRERFKDELGRVVARLTGRA